MGLQTCCSKSLLHKNPEVRFWASGFLFIRVFAIIRKQLFANNYFTIILQDVLSERRTIFKSLKRILYPSKTPFPIRIFSLKKLFNYTLTCLTFCFRDGWACVVCASNPTLVTGWLIRKWLTCFCVSICCLCLSFYSHGDNFYFLGDIFFFLLDSFHYPIRKSLLQSL